MISLVEMDLSIDYFFRKKDFPFKEIFDAENVLSILKIKDEILSKQTEKVFIDPSTTVKEGVVIEGRVYIGKNCVIGPHAYIRNGTIIGDNCGIGRAEIKNSVIMNGSKVPHHCYIGDSVLGCDVNMGAGTVLANFKFEGKDIIVDGMNVGRKFGAIIGDDVSIGCNTTCSPGTLIGPNTWTYQLSSIRGFIPEDSIVKCRIEQEIVEKK